MEGVREREVCCTYGYGCGYSQNIPVMVKHTGTGSQAGASVPVYCVHDSNTTSTRRHNADGMSVLSSTSIAWRARRSIGTGAIPRLTILFRSWPRAVGDAYHHAPREHGEERVGKFVPQRPQQLPLPRDVLQHAVVGCSQAFRQHLCMCHWYSARCRKPFGTPVSFLAHAHTRRRPQYTAQMSTGNRSRPKECSLLITTVFSCAKTNRKIHIENVV